MFRLLSIAAGLASVGVGIRVFGCDTLSFGSDLVTCNQDSSGLVPGWLAALVLVGLGLVFIGGYVRAR